LKESPPIGLQNEPLLCFPHGQSPSKDQHGRVPNPPTQKLKIIMFRTSLAVQFTPQKVLQVCQQNEPIIYVWVKHIISANPAVRYMSVITVFKPAFPKCLCSPTPFGFEK